MPRFKPTAKLERNALADLWKHTLSRIPTVFGRLVYLSSLRDGASGTYRHHGLVAIFGRDESLRALKESHAQIFFDWNAMSMAERSDDLKLYLASLDDPAEAIMDHWTQSKVYRSYVPPNALGMETELFCSNLEALIAIAKNNAIRLRLRSAVEAAGPSSSRPE